MMTKTNKIKIIIISAAALVLLSAASFFIFLAVMNDRGYGMSVGRALYTKDGSCMIVVDETSPIIMLDRSIKGELFDGISTGDEILVIHSGIEESYPARTAAYWLVKTGEGDRGDISEKVTRELSEMGWLSHIYSEDLSFSLKFGTYGESFYDSKSGELIKTTNASDPQKYVTELHLSDAELETIFNMIWDMDISAYPDEYDPVNPPDATEKLMSEPYETIVLTYRAGDYEKTIRCKEVAVASGGYDERSRAFLELCDYIERLVVNSDEWLALPEYEMFYE